MFADIKKAFNNVQLHRALPILWNNIASYGKVFMIHNTYAGIDVKANINAELINEKLQRKQLIKDKRVH